MKQLWSKVGQTIHDFVQWALQSHPGKLMGTLAGVLLALLIIVLGFWQTLLLFGLSSLGFYLGKLWDDGQGTPSWLDSLGKKILRIRDKFRS